MFQAFSVGPFLFWTRAIFLLLGIWLAAEFFFRLATSARLNIDHFKKHAWRYGLAFLLGGRLFAVLTEYRVYMKEITRIFILWDGSFSFLGGAVAIALVLNWATREHRSTFLQWLDVITPAACFGLAFDWIGKFLSGRSYGSPTDAWWAVTYDSLNVRYVVPVHPVQLYYAIFFLGLTFLLLVIRKRARRAGSETLFGIVIASLMTFFLEMMRGDFGIPVFATQLDFIVLLLLFVSLGIFAAVELRLSKRAALIYEFLLIGISLGYFVLRSWLALPTFELRFSQFLAILALLGTVVYVIVHRRKYPHL